MHLSLWGAFVMSLYSSSHRSSSFLNACAELMAAASSAHPPNQHAAPLACCSAHYAAGMPAASACSARLPRCAATCLRSGLHAVPRCCRLRRTAAG